MSNKLQQLDSNFANRQALAQMKKGEERKKLFDDEMRDRMSNVFFPAEFIPGNFTKWLASALKTESHKTLEVSREDMTALHNMNVPGMPMHLVKKCIDLVFTKSPEALGLPVGPKYIACMDQVVDMGTKWLEICKPIQEAASSAVEAKMSIIK